MVKRASPGAEDAKNPLQDVELSDEDAVKLDACQKAATRVELKLERQAQLALLPVFKNRREVLKTIPKFWPVALMNSQDFAFHAQHTADQSALSYLEDVWVDRNPEEPRCFTLEFYFKENPYFSDTVLKKEFKLITSPGAANGKPDEDGITEAMLDFSWERDVESTVTKIQWKDESKALTKLYPREAGEDDDDIPADSGSFFNFFEQKEDPFEIGITVANDIFGDAIEYFLGNHGGEMSDSEDEDSGDDNDDDEIDLEKPKTKKPKH